MLSRTRVEALVCGTAAWIAFAGPVFAQTAGEGSGSEAVGGGAMIKSPEHAEKGGDTERDPKPADRPSEKPGQRSDEDVSSGSTSPSTAPK